MGKSVQQVFGERTEYSHALDENCYEWIPNKDGLEAWQKGACFNVRDNEIKIAGAASLTNMSVVYTCTAHGCIIHCPCSCCQDQRNTCKKVCQTFPCTDCSSQCTEHKLTLHRLFDPASDHFTMVTDRIDCARYAIPYSGIPRSCQNCTRDTYEHQIFHHVYHGRCKFCVMEMRPMRNMMDGDVTLKAFKKAFSLVRQTDERTCAHCLAKLDASYERKIHEKVVHDKIDSDHKCDECGKIYTNSTSLKYHVEKHKEPTKFSCDICDKSFVSKNGFDMHQQIVHNEEGDKHEKFLCEICNKQFTTSSNLSKHKRVLHYKTNTNHDFADSFKVLEFKCDECEKVFKRKDILKRHKLTVHDKSFTLDCPSCEKKFKRRDKLTEHMKLEHAG